MVDVAGLGVAVVGTSQVAHTFTRAELLQPIAPAVVEDPDTRVGIIDALGADDRALEDLQILVIRGNKDVHRGQLAHGRAAQARVVAIRLVAAIGPARHHQKAEEVVEDEQQLGNETRPDPKLPGHAQALDLEGFSEPPNKIAHEKGGPAQRHEAARPGAIVRQRRRDGEKDADHEDQRGRSRAGPHGMRLRPTGDAPTAARRVGGGPHVEVGAGTHEPGSGPRSPPLVTSRATAWGQVRVSSSRPAATRCVS